MPTPEIIFVREPPSLPYSLGPEWIREFSGAAELAHGSPQQQRYATTNPAGEPKPAKDLFALPSRRAFNASNVVAGISMMAVIGVAEDWELLTTAAANVGVGKIRSLTFTNVNSTDLRWEISPIHSFLASTTNEASASETDLRSSRLIERIVEERSVADVDLENAGVADAATRDALALIQRTKIRTMPRLMFSEDGVLALQWQRGEYGVALVFSGNARASISFRRPGQFYAENGIEVSIFSGLPSAFEDAIAKVLG
jgi:hypothetical protein